MPLEALERAASQNCYFLAMSTQHTLELKQAKEIERLFWFQWQARVVYRKKNMDEKDIFFFYPNPPADHRDDLVKLFVFWDNNKKNDTGHYFKKVLIWI